MPVVTESAPANQRGYYGAFAQAGAPIGVILANLALIITSALVSDQFFNTWGWRIPFLASAVLIFVSMYIQLNLEDTKAFKELAVHRNEQQNNQKTAMQKSPIIEAVRKYPKGSCWQLEPLSIFRLLFIFSSHSYWPMAFRVQGWKEMTCSLRF